MRWRIAFWGLITQCSACFGNCSLDTTWADPVDASNQYGGFGGGYTGGYGGNPFGGGGTGAGPDVFPKFTRVGRACATDAECGDGLTCVRADSAVFDGEGPAKGMCTLECTDDETLCAQFGVRNSLPPACLPLETGKSYCFERCEQGWNGSPFDSNKCHGRFEVACAVALTDEFGSPTVTVCVPQCNVDSDCGGGLACNPRTGRCTTTVVTGEPIGAACTPQNDDAATSECRGSCQALAHDGEVVPFTHACTERCTLGTGYGCGWPGPGSGPAPGACLFPPGYAPYSDVGYGDLGSCGQLCDDNCDCSNPALVCRAWSQTSKDHFLRGGYCGDPLQSNGVMDPGIACSAEPDAGSSDAAAD